MARSNEKHLATGSIFFRGDHNRALPKVRKHFVQSLPTFNRLIKKHTAFELDANYLLAEQMLEGQQVTVEGVSWNK